MYGGHALYLRLHNFIIDCWSAKCLPQQWKNANIILAYRQKGDRAECGNSRRIFLSLYDFGQHYACQNHAHPSPGTRYGSCLA